MKQMLFHCIFLLYMKYQIHVYFFQFNPVLVIVSWCLTSLYHSFLRICDFNKNDSIVNVNNVWIVICNKLIIK